MPTTNPEPDTTEPATTKPEPIASVTVPQNYYTIQAGDTIYKIAMKFYNNESMIEQIKNANNIVNEDHV